MNYAMALLTGCLWYSQFLFYGLGHVRMGEFEFSSWAIHMIMLILFSSLTGIVLKRMARPPETDQSPDHPGLHHPRRSGDYHHVRQLPRRTSRGRVTHPAKRPM